MGALIPTPNDQEIIAKLNLRFSRSGLNTLRRYQNTSGDSLFGGAGLPPRSLERVSIRLRDLSDRDRRERAVDIFSAGDIEKRQQWRNLQFNQKHT